MRIGAPRTSLRGQRWVGERLPPASIPIAPNPSTPRDLHTLDINISIRVVATYQQHHPRVVSPPTPSTPVESGVRSPENSQNWDQCGMFRRSHWGSIGTGDCVQPMSPHHPGGNCLATRRRYPSVPAHSSRSSGGSTAARVSGFWGNTDKIYHE